MTCAATRHGTLDAYRYSDCRCPQARAEATRAQKLYRLRVIREGHASVDGTGTHRRIQALAAIDWRAQDIADAAGMTDRGVSLLLTRRRLYVRTAQRIATAYDELADRRGPSPTAGRRAITKGWLPPLWWDQDNIDDPTFTPTTHPTRTAGAPDLIAVERAMSGERLPLTRPERLLAVELLNANRLSRLEIARRLGMHDRQVYRDLTELQLRPTASALGGRRTELNA